MQREFVVRTVSYREFNTQCSAGGGILERKPGKHSQYLLIRSRLRYGCLVELLDNLPDELQKLKTIWFPGSMSPKTARERTCLDFESYSNWLIAEEQNYDSLQVELGKIVSGEMDMRYKARDIDVFRFNRQGDGWSLCKFVIRHPRFYDLRSEDGRFLFFSDSKLLIGVSQA